MSTTATLVDPVVKGKKMRVMPWRRAKNSKPKSKDEPETAKDLGRALPVAHSIPAILITDGTRLKPARRRVR